MLMPGHKRKYDKTGLGTPVQKDINIGAVADSSGAGGTLIVKASRELSMMNNRLYRQCRNYTVSFDILKTALGASSITKYEFFTLPDTWFVRNSVRYAFNTYMQAHEDELRAGVKFARWHDFTIDEQDPDGTWELSQQFLFNGDAWEGAQTMDQAPLDSQVTQNDGSTEMTFRLMGHNSAAYNVFSEYAKLRQYSFPDNPEVTSDQPYDGLLDLKDADNMAEVGDRPPYDSDFAAFLHDGTDDQGILVLQDTLTWDAANAGGRDRTRQFVAPLGLVYVRKYDGDSLNDVSNTQPELILRVKGGKYKGVHAPSLV
uniref:Major capsid protein n=1 Tax=uncultured marine virus TaxID=186617 RepID=S4TF40_9VIRU|nr:hypothetical protein [uncultured marine virus]